jgi:signal transduction histidine kinase
MAEAVAAQRRAQMAFLGGVAHDLRGPLSTLKISIHQLSAKIRFRSEQGDYQAVERIRRQLSRIDRMVDDFLDMARIEAGQLELRLDTHDARRMVEETTKLFEESADGHRLEVHVPATSVPVYCDELRIEQVFTNLIANAIKYSPSGTTVEVDLASHENELELSVTDHGVGISEQDRDRVFEPFRRGGLSKENVPGVGLGLFVVRKIVEAHRGRIEVESTLGEGSTFRVYLPIMPPAGGHAPPPDDSPHTLH